MSTRLRLSGYLLIALAAGAPRAYALRGPQPALNPKPYACQSGEYGIFVDPTDMYGRGAADYQFMHYGTNVWAKRLPFTLFNARVGNAGRIAGFAYSHGEEGFSEKGYQAGMGTFDVVLMSPQGDILARDSVPRVGGNYEDQDPQPQAAGMLIQQAQDRFIVRIRDPDINQQVEQWWTYDLHSGKRLSTLEPKRFMEQDADALWIVDAQPVPATPLTLVHWWRYANSKAGGVFTLVDEAGKPVWTLHRDADYTFPNDEQREARLRERAWRGGGLMSVVSNAAFDVIWVHEQQRVRYRVVAKRSSTWEVREASRTPEPPEPAAAGPMNVPALALREVGVIALKAGMVAASNLMAATQSFAFDDAGNLCALCAPQEATPYLILTQTNGAVLGRLELSGLPTNSHVRLTGPASVGGGSFVIAGSTGGIEGCAAIYRADFAQHVLTPLSVGPTPPVNALAGYRDGRFIALTASAHKYGSADGLFAFDATGHALWHIQQDAGYSGTPDELLSPQDVVACGTQEFAVLDVICHTIQFFSAQGKYVRSINLEQAWQRKPEYPTELAVDKPDGFVVYDFGASNSVVRTDAAGRIRAQFAPRFADGRPVSIRGGVKTAPDGTLWTTDGYTLLRLSPGGVVDMVIGQPARAAALTEVDDSWAVGPDGRIAVADARTHSIHVFDISGRRLAVCSPNPDDYRANAGLGNMALAANGNVYAAVDGWPQMPGYLRFNSRGERLGRVTADVDSIHQFRYFQPTGGSCWIEGYHDLFLVNSSNQVVRRISRRADGGWLEDLRGAAVAPDGSIAVRSFSQTMGVAVNCYAADGSALATFVLPATMGFGCRGFAFDGTRVYIRRDEGMTVFARTGEPTGRLTLPFPADAKAWHGPLMDPQGKELWFLNADDLTVHRIILAESANGSSGP